MSNSKTKIAIFDLTGCEGCEFHLLSLNELLLDIFQDFEIVNWRLLAEEEKQDFDVAFIEGAVTTKNHIKLLKEVRKTSKYIVGLGTCAITGNVFAGLTPRQRKNLTPKIYDKNYKLKAKFLDPIEKHIKIDFKIPGCPPDIEKFKLLLDKFKKEKVISDIEHVIPPDYVAKIEGHGSLKINFKSKDVKFDVEESERLVEGLLLNQEYSKAPYINSRICGICPVAHNLCSWKAIESAFKLTVDQNTILLREVMLAAQFIKSHLLHLFFLVLPDYAGVKSSIELSLKYPAEFHLMLNIKRVAEKALKIVAGSSAFPTNTTLSSFINPPNIEQLYALNEEIFNIFDEAEDLINLFSELKYPNLKTNTTMLCLNPPNNKYPLYDGKINKKIKEIVLQNSTAKLGVLENGEIVKVGALSRLKYFNKKLNNRAKNYFNKLNLDLKNPYSNNISQAVEILHLLEEIVKITEKLRKLKFSKTSKFKKPTLTNKTNRGEAFVEAPRGILYHNLTLDKNGKILEYNIIPPTQINLASLEKEAKKLVGQYKDYHPEAIKKEVEKLIRAFDPCITCAVH